MTLSQSRVTVVEKIYHRLPGQAPTMIRSAFNYLLETEEQVYVRYRQEATKEWTKLEYGWVEQPGLIVIKNEEGQRASTIPAEEEQKEIAGRQLQVKFRNTPDWAHLLILPGEAQRLRIGTNMKPPFEKDMVMIRCVNGPARYTLWALPR